MVVWMITVMNLLLPILVPVFFFLASHMLKQDLNSGIEYLQEQELKQNKCKKIMQEQVLKIIQYLFLHNLNNVPTCDAKNPPEPDFASLSALIFWLILAF